MISITKIFKFEAAHFLPDHDGKCKNVHGHSYKLEVEITSGPEGYLNDDKMIMDFGHLKNLMDPFIDNYFDHKLLNNTLCSNPTAELMVSYIADELHRLLKNPLKVIRVRLWETDTCYAEWRTNNVH